MKLKLTAREEWFLDALVEQYVYGEDRTEVVREALRLLVGKAQDAGRLPRPLGFPPDNNPLKDQPEHNLSREVRGEDDV